ncbi:arsenate reductase (glutaredoxin) [Fulvivirga sp. RKSG066]|uniref:arsenate reductase (glutaredoxin) n=1 Tax=Fulvivirga aurantia TaxID=2529383 RepID=UPI0012BB7BB9|nr:arsenate reductase (glutaredoxin) [Fulvivirga aurantia]MTI21612.1 arsenate reductase (glutaredoxin) [Fulvivirga aurantia]
MLTIYHNPRCSKSREVLKKIEASGQMVQVVEYMKTVPSKEELKDLIEMIGIKPEQLIRKGEADYKENFKGKSLTDDEWVEAMVQYPKLIERPIVIKEKQAAVCRPPEKVEAFI